MSGYLQKPGTGGGGGGSPGGSDTQVQFNDGGLFGGSSLLTFNKSDGTFKSKISFQANIGPTIFSGTGTNNLTTSGTFTGTISTSYTVQINSVGIPNKFSWNDSNGNSGGPTTIVVGTPYTLSDGVVITFSAGPNANNDRWNFIASPAIDLVLGNNTLIDGKYIDGSTALQGDNSLFSGITRIDQTGTATVTQGIKDGTNASGVLSFMTQSGLGEYLYLLTTANNYTGTSSVIALGSTSLQLTSNNTGITIDSTFDSINATGTLTATKSFTSSISSVQFVGSGLDDMTVSGTYTGTTSARYDVVIDIEGTPDAFIWSKNGVLQATDVPITGSPQLLDDGVYVTFGSTTGHTKPDQWTFTGIQFNDAILTNNYDLGAGFGSTATLNGQVSSFDNKTFFNGIVQDATNLETSVNMGAVDVTNSIQSYVTASLDRTQMIYHSNISSYLIGLEDTGMRLFGGNNQTGITVDDITKILTLQSNGTFVLQNSATTQFLNIDTVNENATFGGQSWRAGIYADNVTGITRIGDYNSAFNETKVVVNDIEKTVTLVGGIITPVIQAIDYGDTVTASRGVSSIMAGSAGTGTTTINLDGTYDIGQEFQIFDRGYGAGSNNIVVDAGTGNVIIQKGVSPAQTYTISTNGESIIVKKVSSNEWMIVATN